MYYITSDRLDGSHTVQLLKLSTFVRLNTTTVNDIFSAEYRKRNDLEGN